MKFGKKILIMMFALAIACTSMTNRRTEVKAAEDVAEAGSGLETSEEQTEELVKWVSKEQVEYSTEDASVPVLEGHVFAGWYKGEKTEDESQAYTEKPGEDDVAYAKFVPWRVLSVKTQLSANALLEEAAEPASLRFVTTVDNRLYRQVGFSFKINGNTTEKPTNTVYAKLYKIGETTEESELYPTLFSQVSTKFFAYTITDIPETAWSTEIEVTPYWITLDGTKVYGRTVTKTVNQGRYVARIGTTYYSTLAAAVENAEAGATIEVLQDTVVGKQIQIGKKVTIQNVKGNSVTIKRADSLTASAMFTVTVAGDGDLTIRGEDCDTITIDGNEVKTSGKAMIENNNKFTLGENAQLISGYSSGNGGALVVRNAASITTLSGDMVGNHANQGGAIYVAAGSVTIEKGKYSSNMADTFGGVMYIAKDGQVEIKYTDFVENKVHSATKAVSGGVLNVVDGGRVSVDNCNFINNSAVYAGTSATNGSFGGAINTASKAKNNVQVTNTVFDGNLADGGSKAAFGGAVSVVGSCCLTLSNCEFKNNSVNGTGTTGGKDVRTAVSTEIYLSGKMIAEFFNTTTLYTLNITDDLEAGSQITMKWNDLELTNVVNQEVVSFADGTMDASKEYISLDASHAGYQLKFENNTGIVATTE